MKKLSIILHVILCLSLLSGCTLDGLDSSSAVIPDEIGSIGKSTTSATTTTTTATDIVSTTGDATEDATTTSDSESTTTSSTTNSEKPSNKPSSSANKPSSTAKPTTTTTTTTTTTAKAPTTTAKKSHGTPNVDGTFHDDMAEAVLVMLNNARKEAGLNELQMDRGNMMNAARIRAKEITVHWEHERPDKDRWYSVFDEEGAKYNARGENLAYGPTTADAVFEAWMESPGHKANMMDARFTHISIACLELDGHFYWVQLFGANIR